MITKNKIILSESNSDTDIDKIIEFNNLVIKAIDSLITNGNTFERTMLKVIRNKTIKVVIKASKGKANVSYIVEKEPLINDKQFGNINEFEFTLNGLEEKIKESVI